MELAALIVAFGVLVVSGVAAAAAVIQAKAASDARAEAQTALLDARKARDDVQDLARVSTAAFFRQAEAQEKANALREAESKAPVWSGPRWVSGDLYSMVNTSGRTIKVEQFEVEPDEAERLVRIHCSTEAVFEFGDSFDFLVAKVMGTRARRLILRWRYFDEPDASPNTFVIPL